MEKEEILEKIKNSESEVKASLNITRELKWESEAYTYILKNNNKLNQFQREHYEDNIGRNQRMIDKFNKEIDNHKTLIVVFNLLLEEDKKQNIINTKK